METRATDIANYKGDAATALGSAGGASASPIWGEVNAEGIYKAFDLVAAENLAKNKAIYEKKLKDRDELLGDIGAGKLNLERMLESDRTKVRDTYLAPMREMLLQDPDLKSNPEKYIQFQKLTTNFDEAKTYAQHRLAMISEMDTAIGKELDPERRKKMQAHRDKTAAQGLYEEVKPYQQTMDWDDTAFGKGKAVTTTNEKLLGDSTVTTTETRFNSRDFTSEVWQNYIHSSNLPVKTKMDEYVNSFNSLSDIDKAKKIDLWNQKIAEVNAAENHQEGNPEYIEKIKAFTDATGKVSVNETVPRIILAESLLQNYQNSIKSESKPTKLAADIAAARMQTLKAAREIKSADADDALKYAQARKANADAEQTRQQIKQAGAPKAVTDSDFHINQVLNTFDPGKYQGLRRLPDIRTAGGQTLPGGIIIKSTHSKADPGNTVSALSDNQERLMGRVVPTANGPIVELPDKIIYMDQNKKDPYFVTVFEAKQAVDKEGNLVWDKDTSGKMTVPVWQSQKSSAIIRPNQLFSREVKGIQDKSATAPDTKESNEATARFYERAQTQNMDAGFLSLLEKDDWRAPQAGAAAAPVAAAAPPAGGTKLAPQQEDNYQKWLSTNGKTETGDYDYRGYYKANPGKKLGATEHLTDAYKLPNHITFSSESKYSNKKTPGGEWKKNKAGVWEYTPSAFVLSQHPAEELQEYFKKNEPGAILKLPAANKALADKKKSIFD